MSLLDEATNIFMAKAESDLAIMKAQGTILSYEVIKSGDGLVDVLVKPREAVPYIYLNLNISKDSSNG